MNAASFSTPAFAPGLSIRLTGPSSNIFVSSLSSSTFTPLPIPKHCVTANFDNHRYQQTRRATIRAAADDADTLSLADLQETVAKSLEVAVDEVEAATEEDVVEKLRVKYLGKKGEITSMMKNLSKLPSEERPMLGSVVNKAKEQIAALIIERKEKIKYEKMLAAEDDDWEDVTMPSIKPFEIGRIHPINSTIDLALEVFNSLGFDIIDESSEYNREIETDYFCFEALNCPADHPARDMQDTLYLEEDKSVLLRTQTSAVQARYMLDNKPPFKIIAPGKVYRRDTIDATHFPQFHQIEILAVDKAGLLTLGTLRETVEYFLKKMFGNEIETRFRASYFPFTEPSMEVDVFFRGEWLEVLGCGMVNPTVLEGVGYDPEEWIGFAAGFGVERFAMVMHGITDIRDLYTNDIRLLKEMMISTEGKLDLSDTVPY